MMQCKTWGRNTLHRTNILLFMHISTINYIYTLSEESKSIPCGSINSPSSRLREPHSLMKLPSAVSFSTLQLSHEEMYM
jgi:hypothetical protein